MFSAPKRALYFPLDLASALEATADELNTDCEVPQFPLDSDERVTVLFNLSLNEFVALASAVDAGSDIAYSSDAIRIWELWSRGCVVDICAKIIECIEGDEDVQAALNAWFVAQMADGGDVRDAVYATASTAALDAGRYPYGENLSDAAMAADLGVGFNPGCDPNIVWAQSLALVQKTNRFIVDTLESAELASDVNELAIWAAELPFINLLASNSGVKSAMTAADKLLEFTSEAYLAAYTEAVENEIACAIFCACVDDCVISVDRIFTVMNERVSSWGTFPIFGNLAEWLEWFGGVVVSGGSIVDVIFYAAYGALKVSNFLFFEPGNYLLDTIVAVASDNPSGDWETLCEECPPVCTEPAWTIIDPIGYPGGSVDQTDNMDGTWTVVFTSAQGGPDNAHRIACFETNGCCWKVISAVYSSTPENLDAHYECGSQPENPTWYAGLVAGGATPDECNGGIAASSLSAAFTATVVYELC